jgi:hypothetical protein
MPPVVLRTPRRAAQPRRSSCLPTYAAPALNMACCVAYLRGKSEESAPAQAAPRRSAVVRPTLCRVRAAPGSRCPHRSAPGQPVAMPSVESGRTVVANECPTTDSASPVLVGRRDLTGAVGLGRVRAHARWQFPTKRVHRQGIFELAL